MAKSGNISVILVRSGATEWDEQDRLQGKMDLPLTDAGREGVESVLDAFIDANPGIESGTVHGGPSEGSRETARLVAKRFGVRTKSHGGLEGMDLGLWEGLLYEDLVDRYSKAFKQWREDPAAVRAPEGETLVDLERRLLTTVGKILEKAGDGQVLVLRPIQLTLLVMRLEGEETSGFWNRMEAMPPIQRVELARSSLRQLVESLKASA